MSEFNFSWYILLAALLPPLVLMYLIWKRDKYQREPVRMIVYAFLLGTLSVPLSFVLSVPAKLLWDTFVEPWAWDIATCLYQAFCEAAIPEELAKLAILCLFLRKNKYFDEYMDGIVYAAAIGLGFAGLENILYVGGNEEGLWGAVAVVRALLSVPAHFAFGVIMGYYYSLWKIDNDSTYLKYAICAPILYHGAYDFILMYMAVSEYVALGLVVLFFIGIHRLRKHCTLLINSHLERDKSRFFSEEEAEEGDIITD